jgi:hypothetical protein
MNFTVEPGLATASDEHLSAFLGEAHSGTQALVGTAASNDCHFSFEFSVHRLRYCAFAVSCGLCLPNIRADYGYSKIV